MNKPEQTRSGRTDRRSRTVRHRRPSSGLAARKLARPPARRPSACEAPSIDPRGARRRARRRRGDGGFSPEERAMLANILSLREVRVDDVMVPRADIDAVEIDDVARRAAAGVPEVRPFAHAGLSRDARRPVGMVHIKDLMSHITRVAAIRRRRRGRRHRGGLDLRRVDLARPLAEADLVRNILFVPPSMPVDRAPRLDAGDAHPDGAGHRRIWRHRRPRLDRGRGRDGRRRHRGRARRRRRPDDRPRGRRQLPRRCPRRPRRRRRRRSAPTFRRGEAGEDVDTLGGLVVSLLGRVPVRGELVTAPGGFEFEILDADPRRIKRLRIRRKPSRPAGAAPEAAAGGAASGRRGRRLTAAAALPDA